MRQPSNTPIWLFFIEYYDDCVCVGLARGCRMNARTARAARALFGRDVFDRHVKQWVAEGDIKILSDIDNFGDEPWIEFMGYVSHEKTDAETGNTPSE